MPRIRLFADIGSTFTKLTALDPDGMELLARVQAPTTVGTDVTEGLMNAFSLLPPSLGAGERELRETVACSSAAGGLSMVCIGLVPDYTTQAGRLAALGAGAKVVGEYSYELTESEAAEIASKRADIILLTGGTDGGDSRVIIHNAKMLARRPGCAASIIAAGNCRAEPAIRDAFSGSGQRVYYAPNVMPTLGKLELAPVNELIRSLFISGIVEAKGISRVNALTAGVRMPTPSAVLEAAKLLSLGVPGRLGGHGEMLLVDVGGATTDVCSVASGRPTRDGVEPVGLEEPYVKRTVEGDLGLYHNLDTLASLADGEGLLSCAEAGRAQALLRASLSVPTAESRRQQLLFSRLAVKAAVERHAGRLITDLTPHGLAMRQRGKDLTKVRCVVGSGGPVAFSPEARYVLGGAVFDPTRPDILKPAAPDFLVDRRYILYAIGLLAADEPAAALTIAERYLEKV